MKSKGFILTDEMIGTALAMRDAEPWMNVDRTEIWAVKLSNGETGYCCVELGLGDDPSSLHLYIGRKGFNSLLWYGIGYGGDMKMLPTHDFLKLPRYVIMVDYYDMDEYLPYNNEVSAMYEETKFIVKHYAVRHKHMIQQDDGIPFFLSLQPGKENRGIIDDEESRFIVEAMNATLEYTRTIEKSDNQEFEDKWYDGNVQYPSKFGGNTIPLLTPTGDDKYFWSTIKTPPYYGTIPSPSEE